MMTISFKGLRSTTRGKILTQISCLTMIWIVWRKIVFLIHILKVYNPKIIYNSKKERINKELEITILKILTNQRLYTQIYIIVVVYSCGRYTVVYTVAIIFIYGCLYNCNYLQQAIIILNNSHPLYFVL